MSNYYGRRKIYTATERFTVDNILQEVNLALGLHCKNLMDEEYLYWYRRGIQPVLQKVKQVRPEINHKIVQNIASEIVSFKNGYFLTKPTFYVSRRDDESLAEQIATLNDMLYLSGKQEADNEVVDWFHTVGVAPIYVKAVADDECPVRVYALDPRQAFVVYSMREGNEPVMAVNTVTVENADGTANILIDVFTKDAVFHLDGSIVGMNTFTDDRPSIKGTATRILSVERNVLGEIPIIEYAYDTCRMGSFEKVLDLLDAISYAQSNRLDSEEQFVNNLLVFYNCTLGEDEDGNPITAKTIREMGAIYLKSVGQDKADVKDITAVLDQSQTQVFIDDMIKQVCDIAGMPFSTSTSASTSDNVGAVYFRNGWATADTFARTTEDIFKKSNKLFDKVFLKILKANMPEITIKASDIDIQFSRNEETNLLVKTQGALNLKQLGLSPELVLQKSGVSNDPVGDVAKSKKYIDIAYAKPEPTLMAAPQAEKGANDESNPSE